MDAEAQLTPARLPISTLVISAGALLIFIYPALQTLLIYDREAIAQGEIWRLATGNLVHLSSSHLTYDLAAFLIAGMIIEIRGYRFFTTLCLSAAAFIGIVLFWIQPAMFFYAGLSGVVAAAITYLCLHGLTGKGSWRWLCAAMLAGMTAKTCIELAIGKSFMPGILEEFVHVPLSHLTGSVTATLLFVLLRWSASMAHKP